MSKKKLESITDVIKTVEKKGITVEDYTLKLERDNVALQVTINKLADKLSQAEEEIINLKKMLFDTTPAIEGLVQSMSDEELIADIQLRKLAEKAKFQELNLEEIKRYDLLVKNKRLAQGKATQIEGSKKTELPASKLLEIASKKTAEEK